MPQIINTNIASLNAQRNLDRSQGSLRTALQRLSSGLRINSAKDDAAGLAISQRFTSQINGLNQAKRNANDGISLSQTAEGALGETSNILQRIRQLAVQSANATNSASDRQAIQAEVGQLTSEMDRIAQTASFNGQKLLDGTFGTAQFQVGANANETISATTANFRTDQYGDYRVSGAASSAGTQYRVQGADVTVNGALGSKTVTVNADDSAKKVAEGVNKVSGDTGVSASATTSIDLKFGSSGAYTVNLTSNNSTAKTISFTLSGTSGNTGLSAAVSAFNDVSSQTGVTAQVNSAGDGITLTNNTGENIKVADTTNANAGAVTVGSGTNLSADSVADSAYVSGQVTFDSNKSFNLTSGAGEVTKNASESSALQKVSELDVSTVKGANLALAVVDAALSTVNGQRAKFGALQRRFESTISNLGTTSENLTAARSRIRDADFAKETAALTRNQILQQAGTAILAQANSLPQNVLALLR